MYVCICNAITDKEIKCAVYKGAKCLNSLQKTLPVATQCGSCACLAEEIVDETVAEMEASLNNQVA
jgi:bacterioferritin-associated ferredoxin